MFALVVRFECRDEAAAERFDELTAAVVRETAEHVRRFHARKDPLLVSTRVEFLRPGSSKSDA